MGLDFGTGNAGAERPPRAPSCDLVPALSFLPRTAPGHRIEMGTQHHPAIDRVTPRTPHASHTWVWRGTSRGSQMVVLEMEPAKERGWKTQDLGTRGSHRFAVPPARVSAMLRGIPGLPSGQRSQLVWSLAQEYQSIQRLQQCPCRLAL